MTEWVVGVSIGAAAVALLLLFVVRDFMGRSGGRNLPRHAPPANGASMAAACGETNLKPTNAPAPMPSAPPRKLGKNGMRKKAASSKSLRASRFGGLAGEAQRSAYTLAQAGLPPGLSPAVAELLLPKEAASTSLLDSRQLQHAATFHAAPVVERATRLLHRHVRREWAAIVLQLWWRELRGTERSLSLSLIHEEPLPPAWRAVLPACRGSGVGGTPPARVAGNALPASPCNVQVELTDASESTTDIAQPAPLPTSIGPARLESLPSGISVGPARLESLSSGLSQPSGRSLCSIRMGPNVSFHVDAIEHSEPTSFSQGDALRVAAVEQAFAAVSADPQRSAPAAAAPTDANADADAAAGADADAPRPAGTAEATELSPPPAVDDYSGFFDRKHSFSGQL